MATVTSISMPTPFARWEELDLGSVELVDVNCYRLPLSEALVDAAHGKHDSFELITCRVESSNGFAGMGYTYTGGVGGRAIAEFIRSDLAPMVVGEPARDIARIWNKLQNGLHYVGRGGLLSFAISALDIALWDLSCRAVEMPLAQALSLGKPVESVETYAGFIDLHLDGDALVKNVERAMERGFDAVKTKVGRPDVAEDVARVELMRSTIGSDRKLMVDANFSYDVKQAIALSREIEPLDIGWFEEPISPDDFEGYAQIADATAIPLAMGENLHLVEEFERAVRYSKLAILQPDASNIGGITGWLKVAALADEAGLTVCTHGMHELHVSLLGSRALSGFLEWHSFPIDQYTLHPLELRNGKAVVPGRSGVGVEFDADLLRPFLIS